MLFSLLPAAYSQRDFVLLVWLILKLCLLQQSCGCLRALRYAQLKLTYMDGKVQLNRSNLFLKVFAYFMANKDELIGKTLAEVIAIMFNSSEFMFSATLMMNASGQACAQPSRRQPRCLCH